MEMSVPKERPSGLLYVTACCPEISRTTPTALQPLSLQATAPRSGPYFSRKKSLASFLRCFAVMKRCSARPSLNSF